jgi:hypothetical protein
MRRRLSRRTHMEHVNLCFLIYSAPTSNDIVIYFNLYTEISTMLLLVNGNTCDIFELDLCPYLTNGRSIRSCEQQTRQEDINKLVLGSTTQWIVYSEFVL